MSEKFKEGDLGFRVTYPDRGMCYPQIETFVFVGKNLSDEDTEDTWYFQYSRDYALNGSIQSASTRESRVCLATGQDLHEMFNLAELAQELKLAMTRATSK